MMGIKITKQKAEEILENLRKRECDGILTLKPYIDSLLSQIEQGLPEISAKFEDFSQSKEMMPFYERYQEVDRRRLDFFLDYQRTLPAFQMVIEAYTKGKYTGEGVSSNLGEVRLKRADA